MTTEEKPIRNRDLKCMCGAQPKTVWEVLESESKIQTVRIECARCGRKTGQFYKLEEAQKSWWIQHAGIDPCAWPQ
jgi:hypothetical protein